MPEKRFTRNKEQKIQSIFQTFARLVNNEGYDKLSTRHIAEAANISIGTIYHYFPGGKHSIASGYIENISQQIFELDMFRKMDPQNLNGFLGNYIQKHLKTHRKNIEIHRAIDQAVLANQEVFQRHQKATKTNIQTVIEELKDLEVYRDFPESYLIENFLLFFNLLEAIIHRHLFFNPIYENDEELVKYLIRFFSCLIQNSLLFSPSL